MKHMMLFGALSLMLLSSNVYSQDYEVSQNKKNFSLKSITIKVGDTIKFPNMDPFFHNVYSLSAAKSFELGSYPLGVSRSVIFDEMGEVDVRCAIHDNMKLMVTVEP